MATVFSNDALISSPDAWKRSPLRHNLLANLGGRGLSLLVSLVCVPIYIRVLGIAGYGLIGVWMTLESVSNLVDLGLSPTMTREMAACSARPGGAQDARDLVRTLEAGYWMIGVLLAAVIISCASPIAAHWLRSTQLPPATVRTAIVLIGILILCRWPVTFYCGGLNGLERQVLLNVVGTAYAYLRSLGSVFILLFVSPTIFAFFAFQIAINVVQTAVLTVTLWRCLPPGRAPRFRLDLIRRIWRFAGGTTANTLLWLLLSELDKFVVSAMLPLEAFGYYMLGWRIAACLGVASTPVSTAFFPAFSRQVAARDERRLAELYHQASQLTSVLVIPAALTVIFFAKPLIFAWTGKQDVAEHTDLIAALLTGGLALSCMVNIPYALQLAHGWTSLAFRSGSLALCLSVPLLLLLTHYFGSVGAAGVWLVVNASSFATNVMPMHRRLLTCEARRWLFEDLGLPLLACAAIVAVLYERMPHAGTRLDAALSVGIAAAILGCAALIATPLSRKKLRELVARKRDVSPASA